MSQAVRVTELPLAGAFLFEPVRFTDDRGAFLRSWSTGLMSELGLRSDWEYAAYACNTRRGTLRGLHYQLEPHAERKLVTCVRGYVWDVLLDLREGSPTYGCWHGAELSAHSLAALYVPEGLAHGYISLSDNTTISYHISPGYEPDSAAGARWDDPAFAIDWPLEPTVMSERDRTFPLQRSES